MYKCCLQVHDSVNELDGRVENLNLNQMYANDGLYALCRWVLCWLRHFLLGLWDPGHLCTA